MTGEEERTYRFQMVYGQGRRRVLADDPAELLGYLIPGYLDSLPELRAALRLNHAEESLHRLQQRINVAFGLDDVDSDQWRLLTVERDEPAQIESWTAPVPLVLIDAHYEPYTDLLRPRAEGGRIVWLDTADDEAYLRSVALAGEIFLAVHVAEEAGPEPEPAPEPEPVQATPPAPAVPQWSMPFSTLSSGPAGDVP